MKKRCLNALSFWVSLKVESSERVSASRDGLTINDEIDESALYHVSCGAEYDFSANSAHANQNVLCTEDN